MSYIRTAPNAKLRFLDKVILSTGFAFSAILFAIAYFKTTGIRFALGSLAVLAMVAITGWFWVKMRGFK